MKKSSSSGSVHVNVAAEFETFALRLPSSEGGTVSTVSKPGFLSFMIFSPVSTPLTISYTAKSSIHTSTGLSSCHSGSHPSLLKTISTSPPDFDVVKDADFSFQSLVSYHAKISQSLSAPPIMFLR